MIRTPLIHIAILMAFLMNSFGPIPMAQAQELLLPKPGVMVHLSPEFNPPILKGIKVLPENPFRFEFILDRGDSSLSSPPVRQAGPNALVGDPGLAKPLGSRQQHSGTTEELKQESTKLIKYFLASLTTPEKDLWVNLSPYEKDRIVPESFGQTEMGRDLLAEDYMLKQITASLIYPEDEVGKKFWKRIYEEAERKYGTTNIPVNTFNKVWIVPEKAVVYENAKAGTAYVVESRLKVMLEEDYLSMTKHDSPLLNPPHKGEEINLLGSQIVREIVIPELTREINEGKNFVQLRQVYNSLILATWYKKKIKDSILSQVYSDKNKIAGVEYTSSVVPERFSREPRGLANPACPAGRPGSPTKTFGDDKKDDTEAIYQRYLTAFKKGAYNYIKEDFDSVTQEKIPRKYFSGGWVGVMDKAMRITEDQAAVAKESNTDLAMIEVNINQTMAPLSVSSSLGIGGNFQLFSSGRTSNIYKNEHGEYLKLAKEERNNPELEQEISVVSSKVLMGKPYMTEFLERGVKEGRVWFKYRSLKGGKILADPFWKDLSLKEWMDTFIEVYKALLDLHHSGYSYNDFTFRNILRDEEGKIKLIDYGTSEALSGLSSEDVLRNKRNDLQDLSKIFVMVIRMNNSRLDLEKSLPTLMSFISNSNVLKDKDSDEIGQRIIKEVIGFFQLKNSLLARAKEEGGIVSVTLSNVKNKGIPVTLHISSSGEEFKVKVSVEGENTGSMKLTLLKGSSGRTILRTSDIFPFGNNINSEVYRRYSGQNIMNTILNWVAWEAVQNHWDIRNDGTGNPHLLYLLSKYFGEDARIVTEGRVDTQNTFAQLVQSHGFYGYPIWGVVSDSRTYEGLKLEKVGHLTDSNTYKIVDLRYKAKKLHVGSIIQIVNNNEVWLPDQNGKLGDANFKIDYCFNHVVIQGTPKFLEVPLENADNAQLVHKENRAKGLSRRLFLGASLGGLGALAVTLGKLKIEKEDRKVTLNDFEKNLRNGNIPWIQDELGKMIRRHGDLFDEFDDDTAEDVFNKSNERILHNFNILNKIARKYGYVLLINENEQALVGQLGAPVKNNPRLLNVTILLESKNIQSGEMLLMPVADKELAWFVSRKDNLGLIAFLPITDKISDILPQMVDEVFDDLEKRNKLKDLEDIVSEIYHQFEKMFSENKIPMEQTRKYIISPNTIRQVLPYLFAIHRINTRLISKQKKYWFTDDFQLMEVEKVDDGVVFIKKMDDSINSNDLIQLGSTTFGGIPVVNRSFTESIIDSETESSSPLPVWRNNNKKLYELAFKDLINKEGKGVAMTKFLNLNAKHERSHKERWYKVALKTLNKNYVSSELLTLEDFTKIGMEFVKTHSLDEILARLGEITDNTPADLWISLFNLTTAPSDIVNTAFIFDILSGQKDVALDRLEKELKGKEPSVSTLEALIYNHDMDFQKSGEDWKEIIKKGRSQTGNIYNRAKRARSLLEKAWNTLQKTTSAVELEAKEIRDKAQLASDLELKTRRKFFENIGISTGKKVVEVGFGDDFITPLAVQDLKADYEGYEMDGRKFEFTKAKVEESLGEVGNNQLRLLKSRFGGWVSSAYQEHTADYILMMASLTDPSIDPAVKEVAINEALRIIKPDGRIVISARPNDDLAGIQMTIKEIIRKVWKGRIELKPVELGLPFSNQEEMYSRVIMYQVRFKNSDNTPLASTSKDSAMKINDKGGIDFNADRMNLETRNESGEIKFHLDSAQLAQLQNATGFTPVIINIQPMTNLREFLGLNNKEDKVTLVS
ncbi:MAG: hypothetical protein HQL15_00410 [Candidatus Omnitrophica bacterium]|nr:hypothetical protein [Candidatus Omnitrophota bacterium]